MRNQYKPTTLVVSVVSCWLAPPQAGGVLRTYAHINLLQQPRDQFDSKLTRTFKTEVDWTSLHIFVKQGNAGQ